VEYIALVIALLSLVISFATLLIQRREDRVARSLATFTGVLAEYRSRESSEMRRRVAARLGEIAYTEGARLSDLPDDVREEATAISHFFDHLGAMVAHGMVEKDVVIGFCGGSVIGWWNRLEPYIKAERSSGYRVYQKYFETLNRLAGETRQESIISRLQK